MKQFLFLMLAFVSVSFSSCAQKDFSTLPSGLKYKIVMDKKAPKGKVGDIIKMNLISTNEKDSILYSTYMNGIGPIQINIGQPSFHGDPMEGFALLGTGDSAIFMYPVDSMYKGSNHFPPDLKHGSFMKLYVKVIDHMTAEEYAKQMKEDGEKQVKIDEALIEDYIKTNNLVAQKTASGLYYVVETQGTGAKATGGKKVTVNYTGMTLNGKKFDSNVDPAFNHVEPFSFTLGVGQVIKGWDEGIALFNVGGKGKLLIPSGLGYGAHGAGANIPPNAVLIFEIEVKGLE